MKYETWRVQPLRDADLSSTHDGIRDTAGVRALLPQLDLKGTPGNDSLLGSAGDDTLNGAAGADTMTGLAGDDVYVVDDVGDVVVDSAGKDVVIARNVDYRMDAGIERVRMIGPVDDFRLDTLDVIGNELDNVIIGNGAGNVLFGGDGNDTLQGNGGTFALTDILVGEDGDDLLVVDSTTQGNGGDGNDRIQYTGGTGLGEGGNDTLVGTGGTGTAAMLGEEGDDKIAIGSFGGILIAEGGDGNDTLIGGGFTDRLTDGTGADRIDGGDGNDELILVQDDAGDTVNGGNGTDFLSIDWGDATTDIVWTIAPTSTQVMRGDTFSGCEVFDLTLGSGNDVIDSSATVGGGFIDGGAGNDSLTAAAGLPSVDANVLIGGAGHDTLVGAESVVNILTGGTGRDVLIGGDEHDILDGEAGADRIVCNGGDDNVDATAGNDTLDGGKGVDYLRLDAKADKADMHWIVDASVQQNAAGNTVSGFEQIEAYCGSGNDVVSTARYSYKDFFSGGAGNDSLDAGAGVDILQGDAGNDTLLGGDGADQMTGGDGDDSLVGGNQDDFLDGAAGNDQLMAGDGDDELVGGAGNDLLSGGSGDDLFRLESLVGSDLITDFVSGADSCRINGFTLPVGDGDIKLEGATTIASPGGFAAGAELVIATTDIAGDITAASAAAAIGDAANPYKTGRAALFVVDNGADSAVYYFKSSGNDATVSASELTLLATLDGCAQTGLSDYQL